VTWVAGAGAGIYKEQGREGRWLGDGTQATTYFVGFGAAALRSPAGAMEEVANKPRDPASLARRLTPQVCNE